MAQQAKTFTPGPNQARFIYSTKQNVLAMSPRGEGKTSSGTIAMAVHSIRTPRELWPLKWGLVRDTKRSLGKTTAKTIKEWFPPGIGSKWTGKELEPEWAMLYLDNKPAVEIFFFWYE